MGSEAPRPRTFGRLLGTSMGVAVEGIQTEIVRRTQKADPTNRSGQPWPETVASTPEQTRYELRITGGTVSISDTLTLPDGHLWDLSVRASASATATFTGSSAVPSRKETASELRANVWEIADGGDVIGDSRAASGVTVTPSPGVGVGLAGVFPCQVRGSCTVSLTFVPITDPETTFTLSAVGWYARAGDTTPGALVVATWRRPLTAADL